MLSSASLFANSNCPNFTYAAERLGVDICASYPPTTRPDPLLRRCASVKHIHGPFVLPNVLETPISNLFEFQAFFFLSILPRWYSSSSPPRRVPRLVAFLRPRRPPLRLVFSSFSSAFPTVNRVVAQKLRYHALVLQRRSSRRRLGAAFKPAAPKPLPPRKVSFALASENPPYWC